MLAGFGIPHGIPPNEWYLSELTNLTRPTSCMVTTFVTMQLFLLKTDPMNGSCITHLIFIINNMSCVAQSNITVRYNFEENIISTKF